MGLQEQIAEAIVIAFDDLGGDPQSAVNSAVRHDTVNSWLTQETAMVAVAGGVEMAIPGLHALTIPAGIAYMIHKMAYLSWGIGAIKGAYIVETAQNSDLRNILTLWANDNYYNAHILDHMAIGMDSFEYALTDEGYKKLEAALQNKDSDNVVVKSLTLLQTLVLDFGGDERAQNLVRVLSANPEITEMVISANDRVPRRDNAFAKEIERRISTKLALKLAARISARVPARLAMGFIPFAGPIVNAFFNAQTLLSMADSAQKYYDNRIERETLTGEA
jgi:hypothetical protein